MDVEQHLGAGFLLILPRLALIIEPRGVGSQLVKLDRTVHRPDRDNERGDQLLRAPEAEISQIRLATHAPVAARVGYIVPDRADAEQVTCCSSSSRG